MARLFGVEETVVERVEFDEVEGRVARGDRGRALWSWSG
jgi:hypothetical protein